MYNANAQGSQALTCSFTSQRSGEDSDNPGKEKKKTGFLDLPAELRNRVYSMVLEDEKGIYIESHTKVEFQEFGGKDYCSSTRRCSSAWSSRRQLRPNILATCHTVCQEATPMLYGANELEIKGRGWDDSKNRVVNDWNAPSKFFNQSGVQVSHIRNLRIELPNMRKSVLASFDEIWVGLGKAVNLESMVIGIVKFKESHTEKDYINLVEILVKWVFTQRRARIGTEKKDPLALLQLRGGIGDGNSWDVQDMRLLQTVRSKLERMVEEAEAETQD